MKSPPKKSTASTVLGSGPDFASEADDQPVTITSPFQAADCSQRAQAEAALKTYLQARASEDWASACRRLAKSVRQGYEKLAKGTDVGCAQVLAALSKEADLSDPLTGSLLALR